MIKPFFFFYSDCNYYIDFIVKIFSKKMIMIDNFKEKLKIKKN